MRLAFALAAAAFLISLPVACKNSPDSSTVTAAAATQVHECAGCKDKVTWVYGSWPGGPKGIPTGRKVVTHQCSGCSKSWSSAVAEASACNACMQQAAMCPACQAMKK